MIGNDIVDIKVAVSKSNWRRRRYLDKLFSIQEQETILQDPFPERKLWSLWAMKEATYKAHQRRFCLPRSYNPRYFVCEQISTTSGKVRAGKYTYFTSISETDNYVHCISSAEMKKKYISKITTNPHGLKKAFLKDYRNKWNLPEGVKIIKDEHAVPQLIWQDKLLNVGFSFSNHGSYWAYAAAR